MHIRRIHVTGWSHERIARLCARKLALQFLDALPEAPDPALHLAILQLVQHSDQPDPLILRLDGDHQTPMSARLIATGECKQHEEDCQLALFVGEIWQYEYYFLFVRRGNGQWSAGDSSFMPVVLVAENMPRSVGTTEVVLLTLAGISDLRLH